MIQNRRTPAPYRPNQSYAKDDEDQNSVVLSSPTRENFEETMSYMVTDTKQVYDIDLSMSCSDEQLSEAQISYHAVKVSVTLVGEHRSSVCICLDTRPIGQHQVYAAEDLARESNEKEDYVPLSRTNTQFRTW